MHSSATPPEFKHSSTRKRLVRHVALAYRLTALRNRQEARSARDELEYAIGPTLNLT